MTDTLSSRLRDVIETHAQQLAGEKPLYSEMTPHFYETADGLVWRNTGEIDCDQAIKLIRSGATVWCTVEDSWPPALVAPAHVEELFEILIALGMGDPDSELSDSFVQLWKTKRFKKEPLNDRPLPKPIVFLRI